MAMWAGKSCYRNSIFMVNNQAAEKMESFLGCFKARRPAKGLNAPVLVATESPAPQDLEITEPPPPTLRDPSASAWASSPGALMLGSAICSSSILRFCCHLWLNID